MNINNSLIVGTSDELLTIQELFSFRSIPTFSKFGCKRRLAEFSPEESLELAKLRDNYYSNLTYPRVERQVGRVQARWNQASKRVEIIKNDGKLSHFGYFENHVHCLNRLEALFLLELNRLDLRFGLASVSAEQAYILLLGTNRCSYLDEYLVFTTFSRAGYKVQQHENIEFQNNESKSLEMDVECIWQQLYESLNDNYVVPDIYRNHQKYIDIKIQMTENANRIRNQQSKLCVEVESSYASGTDQMFSTHKNKIGVEGLPTQATRKRKRNNFQNSQSFVNFRIQDSRNNHARELFENVDVINLQNSDSYEENCRDLAINFDIYHADNFKKTEFRCPEYKLIVFGPEDLLPTRSELVKLYQKQITKSSLLVTSVSSSKSIQTFVYHFT